MAVMRHMHHSVHIRTNNKSISVSSVWTSGPVDAEGALLKQQESTTTSKDRSAITGLSSRLSARRPDVLLR
jgi:hypothetical protein